ncbi:MAG TPA: hypothetical protein PK447_02615 [Ignavibacteria bacterium]|nr:hypothetical protein [Ignavibacteria bacterium]
MKIKNLLVVVYALVLALVTVLYSCSSNDNSTSGGGIDKNTISGTITFTDSVFLTDTAHGYYSVDAFATWPPTGNATASLKIKPTKQSDNTYKASYQFTGMASGSYVITSSYIKLPYVVGTSVYGLGIYGCDTAHNSACIYNSAIQKATITNDAGVANINFLSWGDTTRHIYRF